MRQKPTPNPRNLHYRPRTEPPQETRRDDLSPELAKSVRSRFASQNRSCDRATWQNAKMEGGGARSLLARGGFGSATVRRPAPHAADTRWASLSSKCDSSIWFASTPSPERMACAYLNRYVPFPGMSRLRYKQAPLSLLFDRNKPIGRLRGRSDDNRVSSSAIIFEVSDLT